VPGLQPVQPCQLTGTLQLGFRGLGQGQEVGRMPVMRLLPVGTGAQAFQRVFPDRLQQPEPRLAIASQRLDQAVIH
jgi:hypothetical protein